MPPTSEDVFFPFPDAPKFGELVEVSPGILWARLPLPFKLDHVNVYFLEDEDGWVIFDTGIDDEKTSADLAKKKKDDREGRRGNHPDEPRRPALPLHRRSLRRQRRGGASAD